MKVIHIVLGKANPDRLNGVNKMVHELACAQHETGQQVEVWGFTRDLEAPLPRRPFRTRLFSQRYCPFHIDHRFIRELRSEKEPFVIHFHGGFIPSFSTIARRLRQIGIPYCLTAHGAYNVIAMTKSKRKKRLYFQLFERSLLKHAQAVHCIGKSELEALSTLLPSPHGFLIPNGQRLPSKSPAPISSDSGPTFGFCGRLRTHTKGLDIMLKAFASYSREHAGRLLIVGDGRDREKLEQLTGALGLSGRVQFLGALFGDQKRAILSQMDVFLHPSRNEGLPGAVLEAAGIGIPVIVSEATNLADAVRKAGAGIALKKNVPAVLARAMGRAAHVHRTKEILIWRENARKMVSTSFSWDRIAALHKKMYLS